MFFRPDEPHGLKRHPFNALIVPRPIGWISTVNNNGIANLAPYSFFNGVAYFPPQVMFASTGNKPQGEGKDTISNIRETGEFVVNIATEALKDKMNASCVNAPAEEDEFVLAGLNKAPTNIVKAPRIAESPAQFECILTQIIDLPSANPDGSQNSVVFGQVVGTHIDENIVTDGLIDMEKLNPLSRLGYSDYGLIGEVFAMDRPSWPG